MSEYQYDDVVEPYSQIGLGSVASGIPIEGYVDYSYEIGRKGSNTGEFGGWIQHFAVSADGNTLYACDVWNKQIQCFDLPSRKHKFNFPAQMEDYKFQFRGINVLRDGKLCVNCTGFDGTSKIGIFSKEGRLINTVGKEFVGSVCAMTVDNLDRISVMDRRKVQIITLSKEGQKLGQFDPHIDGDILRLACDSRGRILIPDHLNDAVQVYEPNGTPVLRIRPVMNSGYSFKYPGSVTCDADDNIFVSDVGNHRVTQFNSEGVHRATILTKKNNHLWRPHDILATTQGNMLLTEVSGTFVKVFCFGSRSRGPGR